MHGEVGQDFPVDLDAGLSEAADKSAVGQVIETASRIDPLDPESAEIPLLLLAADVVVLQRAVDGRIGRRDRVLAAAVEAFGLLEDALAAGVGRNGTGGAGHGYGSSTGIGHP